MAPILRVLVLVSASLPAVSLAAGAGWKYEWGDEFNGAEVDPAVWGYETGCCRNNEAQYYSDKSGNSRIDNGTLLIQALRENSNGKAYTSANRTTRGKKSFRYGRLEMRAQIDARAGSWPAWWWLPNAGGWPRGGEIDMMEFYQGKCLFNVMDGNQKWTSPTRSIAALGGARFTENFHTWTMVWDSTKIQLSLDGALINDYPLKNADGTGPNGGNPFRAPGYLLLNLAIGGNNGGDPSNTPFPVNLRFDWVRLHTWTQAPSQTVTVTGGAGTGSYAVGTTASITAGMGPAGQIFDKWVFTAGTAAIDLPDSPTAKLTVPSWDVGVAATYKGAIIGILPQRALLKAGWYGLLGFRDVRGRKVLTFNEGEEDAWETGFLFRGGYLLPGTNRMR